MTFPAPEGCISTVLDKYVTCLADSARFRSLVGAADQAAAIEHIWEDSLPQPANGAESYEQEELCQYRPFALVYFEDGAFVQSLGALGGASGDMFHSSAAVTIDIERNTDLTCDPREMQRSFQNDIGVIIGDMEALAGRHPYPFITGVGMALAPFRSHARKHGDQGDYMAVRLRFTTQAGR